MHKRLYYHKTDGGAEYLTDRYIIAPDKTREGALKNAKIIVRIDGNIRRDAEISISGDLFSVGKKGPWYANARIHSGKSNVAD